MRGGFVACLGGSARADARLEMAVSRMRWHTGEPSAHRLGGFQVVCLVDAAHGPTVEIGNGRLRLCHGGPAEPLEELVQRDRFVGVESDGRSLRAARDPMGEVPLFYRRLGDELWLASEIHPLIALAPADPDLDWLAAFAARVEYPERTGWSGIKRALPGVVTVVNRQLHVRSERYFSPRPATEPRHRASGPAAREFRDLFTTAVAKRSTGSCGILLSGGLDSSAIAVVAAQTTRPTILTISHPTLPQVDETTYAQAIADAIDIPLTTLEVEPEAWNPLDDIETFGTPPLGAPTGMYARGFEALAAGGCDVVLDGHDGDGTLGNLYSWSGNTLLDGRFDRFARAVVDYGLRPMLEETANDLLPPSVVRRLRRRPESPGWETAFLPYFRGATAARLAADTRWQPPRRGWAQMQLRALLPPVTQTFEEVELRAARSGIDIRHPFADRDLIEFLIALPHAVKAATARGKALLRDALADLLPLRVAQRPDKTHFIPVLDARVDYEECYLQVRDSGVRLPDIDYGRLFRDAAKPINDRIFWTRLATAHVFARGRT